MSNENEIDYYNNYINNLQSPKELSPEEIALLEKIEPLLQYSMDFLFEVEYSRIKDAIAVIRKSNFNKEMMLKYHEDAEVYRMINEEYFENSYSEKPTKEEIASWREDNKKLYAQKLLENSGLPHAFPQP